MDATRHAVRRAGSAYARERFAEAWRCWSLYPMKCGEIDTCYTCRRLSMERVYLSMFRFWCGFGACGSVGIGVCGYALVFSCPACWRNWARRLHWKKFLMWRWRRRFLRSRQRFSESFARVLVGHRERGFEQLRKEVQAIGRGRSLSVYFGVCSGTAQAGKVVRPSVGLIAF